MREDLLRRGVVGRAVDIVLAADLGARRGAEQVLQRAAGDRIDALVEFADILYRKPPKQDGRVLVELAFDQFTVLTGPLGQVHPGHPRGAQQRNAAAFEQRRETHQAVLVHVQTLSPPLGQHRYGLRLALGHFPLPVR
ncbi:hypothetical protein D9M71_647410 [compost metagenome]